MVVDKAELAVGFGDGDELAVPFGLLAVDAEELDGGWKSGQVRQALG
ncbi:MAG TPA: hypothetical protein VMZ51_06805 [Acidimicrobiales bacterium]|nr:hypothetical protein [Acidimicrobiales bacterium]